MQAHITILTDEELDAVAAGAKVSWSGKLSAAGLNTADVTGTTTITATTTKTDEAASVRFEYSVTTE